MKILALDTTGEFGSLALVEDHRVIEEVPLRSPEGFGHILFNEIRRLVERHGVDLRQLGGFAAASGPGSFTGVRVGLTAVKGLAEATGRPVAAISNLHTLASFGTRSLRAAVLDARRGEIYGAVYDSNLDLVCAEVVMKLDVWLSTLPAGDLEFVTGEDALASRLSGAPVTMAPRSLAGAVGKLAAKQFRARLGEAPDAVDANYVRRSDAELLWKD